MSFSAKFFLLSLGFVLVAGAQTDVGALQGTISDPGGARVAHAYIILDRVERGSLESESVVAEEGGEDRFADKE